MFPMLPRVSEPAAIDPSTDPARAFRARARQEADRYGPDPWVFVRELVQNARDAGAGQVVFLVEQEDGIERVRCIDDGEGMSFEHARRFLFPLYASSKEGAKNQAGRFGVGFWSVLRFEPASIEIRSASPLLPFDPIRDWFTGSNREVGEWIGDEFKIIAPHRNPPVELRINRRTGVLVYNSVRVDERLRTTVIAAQGECRRADGRRHL